MELIKDYFCDFACCAFESTSSVAGCNSRQGSTEETRGRRGTTSADTVSHYEFKRKAKTVYFKIFFVNFPTTLTSSLLHSSCFRLFGCVFLNCNALSSLSHRRTAIFRQQHCVMQFSVTMQLCKWS